ncbi:16S rRNA (uracil(1498)-N(3))-methyltransferase [Nocardioides sp.]|uniref:16S rRNA (uracil(1498)-N(3))-methyltransferase n=1 Tax=Nocardioides sp. TaxID=35761 RepID=UPI003516C1B5
MTLPQHLVPDLAGVAPGATVTVEGDEAHHAVVVRRLRQGERLQLSDGRGRVVLGTIAATAKRTLDVTVEEVVDHPEPVPRITVVQALPKGDRGELAVEVLTEIGVARIVPWAAERSVAVWKGERAAKSLARWRSTAREAAKQSRRAWHPEVTPMAGTDEVVALLEAAEAGVVLHEDAATPLSEIALPPTPGTGAGIAIVVGPEGGLSDTEVARLAQAGGVPVRLGTEVLRTSTAGLAAASALLARTPRWGG